MLYDPKPEVKVHDSFDKKMIVQSESNQWMVIVQRLPNTNDGTKTQNSELK